MMSAYAFCPAGCDLERQVAQAVVLPGSRTRSPAAWCRMTAAAPAAGRDAGRLCRAHPGSSQQVAADAARQSDRSGAVPVVMLATGLAHQAGGSAPSSSRGPITQRERRSVQPTGSLPPDRSAESCVGRASPHAYHPVPGPGGSCSCSERRSSRASRPSGMTSSGPATRCSPPGAEPMARGTL